jgi:gamma-glutamyl:cysteine ligase YbdK (ATP-grasp superfamily)
MSANGEAAVTAEPDPPRRLRLFEAFGVELEYMLVDAATLDVLPRTDEVLKAVAGRWESEVDLGEISWSNELVLHVIELKTTAPAPELARLPDRFQEHVERIGGILAPLGGRLMPTAMHPWMDPARETRLWPHEHSPIYEAFDRIFGCAGHGWSNLQSVHLNLPFADDEEFGRLHAAIRAVLPLLPALAASSPVVEGRVTGILDSRMEAYRGNAAKAPTVGGEVIPEPVYTEADYHRVIFEPMRREIAPHDPQAILHHEFLNSRGAIARFGRGSIEIRVIDSQECPRADLAVAALTVAALKLLAGERWAPLAALQALPVAPLAALLRRCIREGERAEVGEPDLLRVLGVPDGPVPAGKVWRHLAEAAGADGLLDAGAWDEPLGVLLEEGPLARRILAALGPDSDRRDLERIYRRLCDCLAEGEMFRSGSPG